MGAFSELEYRYPEHRCAWLRRTTVLSLSGISMRRPSTSSIDKGILALAEKTSVSPSSWSTTKGGHATMLGETSKSVALTPLGPRRGLILLDFQRGRGGRNKHAMRSS